MEGPDGGALGGALGGAYVGDVRSTRGTGLPGRAFDRDLADRKKALHEGLTLLREGPDALKPPVKPQVAGLPVLQAEALRLQHREMQEALGKVEREIAEAYADLHRKIAPHMTPEEFEHALRTTDIDAFLKGRRSTRLDPPDTLDDLVSGSGLWKTNRQR